MAAEPQARTARLLLLYRSPTAADASATVDAACPEEHAESPGGRTGRADTSSQSADRPGVSLCVFACVLEARRARVSHGRPAPRPHAAPRLRAGSRRTEPLPATPPGMDAGSRTDGRDPAQPLRAPYL